MKLRPSPAGFERASAKKNTRLQTLRMRKQRGPVAETPLPLVHASVIGRARRGGAYGRRWWPGRRRGRGRWRATRACPARGAAPPPPDRCRCHRARDGCRIESNRIEAAGRITSSAGEIRPRGSSSSSRRRSGIGRRRAEALLTREDGGAPQPRRPRGNVDLRAPALPRLRQIGPAPPLPDPPPPPNRAR
jgi:hypothetical protein